MLDGRGFMSLVYVYLARELQEERVQDLNYNFTNPHCWNRSRKLRRRTRRRLALPSQSTGGGGGVGREKGRCNEDCLHREEVGVVGGWMAGWFHLTLH